jgi:hypothetical protein
LTEETRQRKAATRQKDCPFEVLGKKDRVLDEWFMEIKNSEHNHDPSTSRVAHPSLRRLDPAAKAELSCLTDANVAPRTIAAVLEQRSLEQAIVMKDIYNARQQMLSEALGGRTPIQALVEQMQADDFSWSVQHDAQGHVTHLFFAYKKSVEMYFSYPEVLLIDCTYKTNRFHMPLCSIMGVTGVGSSFFVALAFLRTEREADYSWVLQQLSALVPGFKKPGVVITDRDLALMNALAVLFPASKHVLCKWHIKTNVEAKCWPYFKDLPPTAAGSADERWTQFLSDWDAVVGFLTVSEYNRQWSAMKARQRLHHYSLRYVESVWLQGYKERFVYAWTF